MDLSICIVSWNSKDVLGDCINSIIEKTSGVEYEIIIVDNNSTDGTPDFIEKEFPSCKVIRAGKNLGFANGNNLAARHSTGSYIIYLNPDTELKTNALYEMHKYLENNSEFSAIGCKLVYPDGSLQYTCAREIKTPFNEFCELAMLNKIFPKSHFFSTVEMFYWDHNDSREVNCLSGACIMARKSILDKLGGFDPEYFMYAEDVDLCFRIRKEGWKIFYLADETIIHHEGASSKKTGDQFFSSLLQRQSNHLFMKKHFGIHYAFMYRVAVFLGSSARLGVIPFYLLALRISGSDRNPSIKNLFTKFSNLVKWSLGFNNINKRMLRNNA